MTLSLTDLAEQVNAWCLAQRITPANGQASDELTVRTLRYYRTAGLLDAPVSGGGVGYERRHFLQAVAVRVLQAQGLPLSRIHSLLFGRSDDDLQKIADQVSLPEPAPSRTVSLSAFTKAETWQMTPVTGEFFLVSRRQRALSSETLERLRSILDGETEPVDPNICHEP